ncbi:MAG: SsrA-binding protein SmpB [Candidatus Daviesbacteria bacterium]|nr:MAG: SsrA-binding protein SmpB [Candidatus Daviesbacteria bacterium]
MKILNKKALHNYYILESIEAGISLLGSEVKSLRQGRADLGEAYVRVINNEVFLINANIPRYSQTAARDYDPLRSRKLLLHKGQIHSLLGKISGQATTLVPVSVYEKNNRFKVQVGLARSKKQFDKRAAIKARDQARRIEQELRGKE